MGRRSAPAQLYRPHTPPLPPPQVTLIDFPQMVSVDHANAREYFDRDVNGLVKFFRMKMKYFPEDEDIPDFDHVMATAGSRGTGAGKKVYVGDDETVAPVEVVEEDKEAEAAGGAWRIDEQVRASGFSHADEEKLLQAMSLSAGSELPAYQEDDEDSEGDDDGDGNGEGEGGGEDEDDGAGDGEGGVDEGADAADGEGASSADIVVDGVAAEAQATDAEQEAADAAKAAAYIALQERVRRTTKRQLHKKAEKAGRSAKGSKRNVNKTRGGKASVC